MKQTQRLQQVLASEPNPIIKLLQYTSSKVKKIYRGKTVESLMFLKNQMEKRHALNIKMNNQSYFPLSLTAKLEKDQQMRPYLNIESPYFTIAFLPIHQPLKFRRVLPRLIRELLKGSNFFFYSYQNLFFDENSKNQINTNFASNAGLLFVYTESSITKKELAQIYELIDPKMFEREPKSRMVYQLKWRALGVLILSSIIGKRLSLLLQFDKMSDQITFEKAKAILAESNQRFKQLLCLPQIRSFIQAAQENDKLNYLFFLKKVFVDDCEGLTWTEVVNLLVFQRKPSHETKVFWEVAQKLYQRESPEAKQFYESLGLSEKSERQFYLLVKAKVDLQVLFNYRSIDDYLNDRNNWSLDKETICKSLWKVMIGSVKSFQSSLQVGPQIIPADEAQNVSNHLAMQQQLQKDNHYQEFREAFKLIQRSMTHKSLKIQSKDIKFLTIQQRILKQYERL